MKAADFTVGQRRAIILLVVALVVVFAMLAGFIVTSLQGMENLQTVATPSFPLLSSASPSLSTPTPTLLPSIAPVPTSEFEEGIWSQVQAARLFDQIAHQVETIRGLSPRAEVPLSFRGADEMALLLRRFYAGRDLLFYLTPYVELGLLPDVPVSIRPRQVVGIYVPEDEQLYVNTEQQAGGANDQAMLAHAYIHALQDQYFGLEVMDARATTTDAKLAVQALVEGDASLSTALYRYGEMANADWEHVATLVMHSEQPDYGETLKLAKAWGRLQHFPYWEGRRFAQTLYQAGGWQAINGAYVDPPRSTEEILHPERYLSGQGDPTLVAVPEFGAVLDEEDGWTILVRDTLGEVTIGMYLETLLPEDMAWQAADGWGGDSFVVWEREDGGRVSVWRTIWDSTTEAAEFESALAALIPQRHLPAWPVDPPRGLGGRWWQTAEGEVYVCRVARYVTLAQASDIGGVLMDVVSKLP